LSQTTTIALDRIHVPTNVRQLDPEHVKALAASIRLQGILVPVVVCPAGAETAGKGFELVAGFHRTAAARELGLGEIPAVVRDAGLEAADRAIENIARLALRADDEARAVKAMLDKGFSEDGAAQALGWPKARVTARVKLLELLERAQQLVGQGVIPLSAVDRLLAIGRVSSRHLEVIVEFLASGPDGGVLGRLSSDPGRVLGQALRERGKGEFAAYMNAISANEAAALKLGKKTEQLLGEAAQLGKQLDRYAYGPPTIRFGEQDVDQARAAGVLIELGGAAPIIVDRAVYRELAKAAIKRAVEELRAKAADRAEEKTNSARRSAGEPADPATEVKREHNRRVRELAEQAHGANLDLWASLANGLAAVDPASNMDVARFFTYALLGPDRERSPYEQARERVARLAACGIRLVVAELRTDVTTTRKDGPRGALRIDYGPHNDPQHAIKWLWNFIDAARTPAELFGRCLVVVCAEQHACRLVVPASQRGHRLRWDSHNGIAAKALAKLATPHMPGSLKQLEKAIEQAERERDVAERRGRKSRSDVGRGSAEKPAESVVESDEEKLEAAA
jgi:ParB/RepB/Spo0J family partition protein